MNLWSKETSRDTSQAEHLMTDDGAAIDGQGDRLPHLRSGQDRFRVFIAK